MGEQHRADEVLARPRPGLQEAAALAAVELLEAAESLLREALTLGDASDDINSRADALFALAQVLQGRGCKDDAREAAEAAIELYAAKRNIVLMKRAEALLGQLQATARASS